MDKAMKNKLTVQRLSKGRALQMLAFCCLFFCAYFLANGILMGRPKDENVIMKGIEKPGTVDIALMGTSRVYRGLYPMELYLRHGYTSINQGQGGQTIPMMYYAIRDMVEKQRPKLIVADLSYLFFPGKFRSSGDAHRTIDSLSLGVKADCVTDAIPQQDWAEFFLPITLYHNRWKVLSELDFTVSATRVLTKGSVQVFTEKEFEKPEYHAVDPNDKKPPPAIPVEYLDRIIQLCKNTDTELLLTVLPYRAWGTETDDIRDLSNEQRYYHWMRDYADQQNVPFLNMLDHLDEIGFEMAKDLSDWGHVNYFGGKKITNFLGVYLQAHYGDLLQNHQGESGYESWGNQVDAYNAYVAKQLSKLEKKK